MHHALGQRITEAVPLDRRVAVREALIQQLAILDEEERAHHQRRHRRKIGVPALRKGKLRNRAAVTAENGQAGLRLFPVDRKQAEVGEAGQPERGARLTFDGVTLCR